MKKLCVASPWTSFGESKMQVRSLLGTLFIARIVLKRRHRKILLFDGIIRIKCTLEKWHVANKEVHRSTILSNSIRTTMKRMLVFNPLPPPKKQQLNLALHASCYGQPQLLLRFVCCFPFCSTLSYCNNSHKLTGAWFTHQLKVFDLKPISVCVRVAQFTIAYVYS